jgi:hypothetical protein
VEIHTSFIQGGACHDRIDRIDRGRLVSLVCGLDCSPQLLLAGDR